MRIDFNSDQIKVLILSCVGLALRGITSLGSYSGSSTPPMFGDYEAQRHWQEITYNLPAKEWYTNSSNNDLLYWGLDYPPLTAYHSFLLGWIANTTNENFVQLFKSRAYESKEHKSFMRFSVLAADILVYIPACILLVFSLEKWVSSKRTRLVSLMLLICYPGLILIDNGHFQYNNISLGLMLVAVSAILRDSYVWSALFFSLALNYKQMELYHALPFFVMLLRAACSEASFKGKASKLAQIGFITTITFSILWWPWLYSKDAFLSTLGRLFPFNRGVFEDKVSNVWCSLNVLYKFKEKFSNSQMAVICLTTTISVILPINIHAFYKGQKKTFLYALFNTSIAFFLLSFQVHEKSILLAAIPAICLYQFIPFNILVFLKVSVLSMLPLLQKDHLCVAYFCMLLLFSVATKYFWKIDYSENENVQKILSSLMVLIDVVVCLISLVSIFVPSPARLPHLWPLFISVFCCGCFLSILIVSVFYQFQLEKNLHRIFYKIVPALENKAK